MKRKGGLVWYQSIGICLTYVSAIFLDFFKGASRALNLQKPVYAEIGFLYLKCEAPLKQAKNIAEI